MDLKLVAPAGALHCNVTGMARWMETQLAGGAIPGGGQLFTPQRQQEMWTPQTLLPSGGPMAAMTHTHFQTYALGWGLQDFDGYQRISHNGGVIGMVTHVSLIPELKLGVVVLTNQEDAGPLISIPEAILESYTSTERHDWVSTVKELLDGSKAAALAADAARAPKGKGPVLDVVQRAPFVGDYSDPWRGLATVSESDGSLRLTFSRTKSLQGRLVPTGDDLFIVEWADRSLHADAYVRFRRDYAGQPDAFTMQAVSALTDFSFDFQDLDFHRVISPAAH
jgi:CubicO group peptidase (beta-lactamase class C family)